MGTIKIILDQNKCIGAGTCTSLSAALWRVEDGKAILKGAKQVGNKVFELVLDEKNLSTQSDVAAQCPSAAIKVTKL